MVSIGSPYTAVTKVTGDLSVIDSNVEDGLIGLPSLQHVVGGVWIVRNKRLTQISDLDLIATIGGNVQISLNPAMLELRGLSSLTTLGGGISIHENTALESCTGFRRLRYGGVGLGYPPTSIAPPPCHPRATLAPLFVPRSDRPYRPS